MKTKTFYNQGTTRLRLHSAVLFLIICIGFLFISNNPGNAQAPVPPSQLKGMYQSYQIEHFSVQGTPYLLVFDNRSEKGTIWTYDQASGWQRAKKEMQLPEEMF